MAFSATDIAFEGFRITRERPLLVLGVTVFQLAMGIALSLVVTAVFGRDPATLIAELLPSTPPTSEAEALRVLKGLLQVYVVVLPMSLVLGAVICCAIYRAVLRPGDRALAYIGFGPSEARLLAVLLVYLAVSLAGTFALALAQLLASFSGPFALVLTPLFAIGVLCAMVWLCVRLSFAGPTVFAERRFDLTAAWRQTRGLVGKLLGAYLLALALAVVVFLLGALVTGGITLAIAGGPDSLPAIANADLAALTGPLAPAIIVAAVLKAMLSSMIFVIVLAPPAAAYRALRADEPAAAF